MWLVALLLLVNLLLIIRLWSLESSVQELSAARGTLTGHKPFFVSLPSLFFVISLAFRDLSCTDWQARAIAA